MSQSEREDGRGWKGCSRGEQTEKDTEKKRMQLLLFFFLNFKFYLMKFLFLELKDRHDGKLKKILDVFEN